MTIVCKSEDYHAEIKGIFTYEKMLKLKLNIQIFLMCFHKSIKLTIIKDCIQFEFKWYDDMYQALLTCDSTDDSVLKFRILTKRRPYSSSIELYDAYILQGDPKNTQWVTKDSQNIELIYSLTDIDEMTSSLEYLKDRIIDGLIKFGCII
jgi:hypothetical protein